MINRFEIINFLDFQNKYLVQKVLTIRQQIYKVLLYKQLKCYQSEMSKNEKQNQKQITKQNKKQIKKQNEKQIKNEILMKSKKQEMVKRGNELQRQKGKMDVEQQGLKKIRLIEQFFNRKYLGNKNDSKSVSIKRVLRNPEIKLERVNELLKMKTNNLNIKMVQIEQIFKTEKKRSKKKVVFQPQFTAFELYLTKRDILRQRNEQIDQIRKLYNEQKEKKKNIKTQGKQDNFVEVQKISKANLMKKQIHNSQEKYEKKNKVNNEEEQNDSINNISENPYKPNTSQQKKPELSKIIKQKDHQKNQQILQANQKQSQNNTKHLKNAKSLNDKHFQKLFQQNILKNKFNPEPTFSIQTLIQPNQRRKTTLNSQELFQKELSQIQTMAKQTVDYFKQKQKINSDLYNTYQQSQNDYQTVLKSAMSSPIQFNTIGQFKPTIKSINWVINQCNKVKQFKVRKSKSLKTIKKYSSPKIK